MCVCVGGEGGGWVAGGCQMEMFNFNNLQSSKANVQLLQFRGGAWLLNVSDLPTHSSEELGYLLFSLNNSQRS